MRLVIGNRNYSSWSLRAWLYMVESQLEFELVRIPLFTADWKERIGRYSPAGRVPVLLDGDVTVWDSAAIMGYLHNRFPDALGWPEDRVAQAHARSIAAEMHSGFLALRDELPQNIRSRSRLNPAELSSTCKAQIARVISTWSECREAYAAYGPGLFGKPCIADVMYAPVVLRFRSYGIAVDGRAAEYGHYIESLESIKQWSELAASESESLDFIDRRTPASEAPLVLG